MNIADFIPEGHEKALTADELAALTSQDTRTVRAQISEARRSTVILNMQDGAGYFRPTEEDRALIERWKKQEESRLKRHALALRAVRQYLKGGQA